jgi:membrane protein YdbS with pleckstrin-like domain
MPCPACSFDAPLDSVYCPKCGHRLSYPAPGSPAASNVAASAPANSGPAAAGSPNLIDKVRAGRNMSSGHDAEVPLWEGSYSPKAMYGSWLLAGFVTLAALVLTVVFFAVVFVWLAAWAIAGILWITFGVYYLIERYSIAYTLTSHRFVHQTGILRRVINRIETIDIDDVTIEQGFIERMFGVGKIHLLSSDTSHPELLLRGIDDVRNVANMIDNARRDERRKRGMYIESV